MVRRVSSGICSDELDAAHNKLEKEKEEMKGKLM